VLDTWPRAGWRPALLAGGYRYHIQSVHQPGLGDGGAFAYLVAKRTDKVEPADWKRWRGMVGQTGPHHADRRPGRGHRQADQGLSKRARSSLTS
jgi:hypothetical protein